MEGDANCTACKNPFQLEELNRNLVNMFGFIRFNCKLCNHEFRFSERRTHLLTCAGVQLSTCAFGCTDVNSNMMDHMKSQCNKQPKCGACDFRIYTKYHTLSAAHII